MNDIDIETKGIYEFIFEDFSIVYDHGYWYVEFADPELEDIVLEDEEGCHFTDSIDLLEHTLTKNKFQELKNAIQQNNEI